MPLGSQILSFSARSAANLGLAFVMAFSPVLSAAPSRSPASGLRPDAEKIASARALAAAGKPTDAAKSLTTLADQEKDRERRSLLRMAAAVILYTAANDSPAREQFSQALADGTRISDYAHFYLGLIAKRGSDPKTAHEEFSHVIDLKAPPATTLDARYELAELALSQGQWRQAVPELEILRKGLRSDSRYPEILYDLLRAKHSLGSSLDCRIARDLYAKYPTFAAISDGDKAWGPRLESDTIDGKKLNCVASNKDLKTRVRRLWIGGDNQRADAELNLIRGGPDPDAESDDDDKDTAIDKLLVNHMIADGKIDDAMRLLLQHYDREKVHVGYLQLLAKAASGAGENEMAVSAYQRAFDLAPNSKNGLNSLFQAAFTSYQMQDYDGASRKFELFLKRQSHTVLARDSQWYLAWIRYLRGDYQGAYESFAVLAKAPPLRARHRRRRRRFAAAQLVTEGDTIARDRLQYWSAMSLFKMGKAQDALPLFQKLALDPALGYYSMLAYDRLQVIPGGKVPDQVEIRLGLKRSGTGTAPNEDELEAAVQNAVEEARAEYEADTGKEDEAETSDEAQDTGDSTSADTANSASKDVVSGDKSQREPGPDIKPEPLQSEVPAGFKDPILATKFERARDLAVIGLEDGARRELLEIEKHARSAADRRLLMSEYANVKNYERSSYIGEIGFSVERLRTGLRGESKVYWEHAYPRAWEPSVVQASKATSVPEELIWSIMRAESHYRYEAQSPVGALGLMQLMPFTGRKVADLLSIKSFLPQSLLEPEVNIRLGSRYLQRLAEKFSGKMPLVAASYNAGPHRVYAWVKNFGTLDMDEFVEHIPFVETRNYVKRVVRNFAIYNLLYHGNVKSFRSLIQPIGLKLNEPLALKEIW